MMPITKTGITILLDMPEGEKKEARYSQPSFVKACRGNERVASILDHFIYGACNEIKVQGLSKDCKVVSFTRTHEKILRSLSTKMSEKSLIRYLKLLHEWKMVDSEPYQRAFTVHLDVIQEDINNPPPPTPRKPRTAPCRTQKGGQHIDVPPSEENDNVVSCPPFDGGDMAKIWHEMALLRQKVDNLTENMSTLQPLEEGEDVRQKVDNLQPLVDNLQPLSGQLTTFSGQLTTLQRDFEALVEQVQELKNSLPIITYNILPIDTNNICVSAFAEHTHHSSFSVFDMDEESCCISVEDVLAYQVQLSQQHPPVVEQTSMPLSPDLAAAVAPTLEEIGRPPDHGKMNGGPIANGTTSEKPATTRRTKAVAAQQITLQGQHIIDLYQTFKGRKVTLNSENVKAANGLGDTVMSDEDFKDVLHEIKHDPFLKEKKVRIDLDFVYRKYDGFLGQVDDKREAAKSTTTTSGNGSPPPPKKLIAATPGSQYIVDAIVEFEDTEFRAWQKARDEAEAAQQYAGIGG